MLGNHFEDTDEGQGACPEGKGSRKPVLPGGWGESRVEEGRSGEKTEGLRAGGELQAEAWMGRHLAVWPALGCKHQKPAPPASSSSGIWIPIHKPLPEMLG